MDWIIGFYFIYEWKELRRGINEFFSFLFWFVFQVLLQRGDYNGLDYKCLGQLRIQKWNMKEGEFYREYFKDLY